MAVIVISGPEVALTDSGTPLVANTADDADVQEIVIRVGHDGALRLSIDEALDVQRDLIVALSVGLRPTIDTMDRAFEALPFEWKQCDRCRHLRKTLGGICGNCADDLRMDAQAEEMSPDATLPGCY